MGNNHMLFVAKMRDYFHTNKKSGIAAALEWYRIY